jgi:hypothetical protein
MSTYRLFPSASGPSSPVSYSGPFIAGVVFEVNIGAIWLEGYWWWVCDSGQSTAPQTFALWQQASAEAGMLVSDATVTSGTLTAGQWNFIPLSTSPARDSAMTSLTRTISSVRVTPTALGSRMARW